MGMTSETSYTGMTCQKKSRAKVKVVMKNHNVETLTPIIMYFYKGLS